MKKRLFGLLGACSLAFASVPVASAFEYTNSEDLNSGKTPDGSYDYVCWNEGNEGETSFDGDKINGGQFLCKWSDISSCSFSKGHILNSAEKTYKELGEINCDYSIEHSSDGNSYFGIHGWFENREKGYQQSKYAEYFIIDGYTNYRPYSDEEPLGSVTVDDCTYDIYRIINASFDSPVSFKYYSVISSEDNKVKDDSPSSVSHHISIDDHFAAWENAGIDVTGKLYEVSFDVEGWRSSGEANVTKNDLVFDEIPEPEYEQGDANADGDFSIADLVIMQKWLLGASGVRLANWKAADFNGDNKLNVFDLCLMKRELFNKRFVQPDHWVTNPSTLFVVKEKLEMYYAPNSASRVVGTIPETRVKELGYTDGDNNWVFTEYEGTYGWIKVYDDENNPNLFWGQLAAKPVIYLYPEKETDVHIELDLKEADLSTTYPKYNNGWYVTAYPDGSLLNKTDGTHHRYLFWDAVNCRTRFDFSKGFCVAGSDTESFLREKLTYIGLTEEEMNEFIVYWLPIMEHNKYNLISFQNETYTESAKLSISPSPDSLLRVFMAFVPIDAPVEIEPQQLGTFERNGFTVVEWGGCEVT